LDDGPEIASNRTQFLKRSVALVDRHRVTVELVYLPPYHSKYNPVQRCWDILKRYWNGALLGTVADVLRWAGVDDVAGVAAIRPGDDGRVRAGRAADQSGVPPHRRTTDPL